MNDDFTLALMTNTQLGSIGQRPAWIADALCAQVDVGDIFHPEKGESNVHAKKVCNMCDVRHECLEWALHRREFGVWGGTSEREREQMRRDRGIRLNSGQVRCGTDAGARAHYRRGEKPCPRCAEAQLQTGRDRREQRRA